MSSKKNRERRYIVNTLLIVSGNILAIKPGYPPDWSALLKLAGYLLQLMSIYWQLVASYAFFKHRNPKNKWEVPLTKYRNIFTEEIKKKRNKSRYPLTLAIIISTILKTITFFALTLLLITSEVLPYVLPESTYAVISGFISYLPSWVFPVSLSVTIACLLSLWFQRSHENSINCKRSEHLQEAITHLRSTVIPNGNGGITSEQTRALILRVMRLALESTTFGIRKTLARKLYRIKTKLGPKSVWLFFPEIGKGHFTIAEYDCLGGTPCQHIYEEFPQKYHPKLLDIKGWKLKCNNIASKSAKEEEDELKEQLFNARFEYGSDLGIIAASGITEYLWLIPAKCKMHNYDSYSKIIVNADDFRAYCFRSCIVVPVPYKVKKHNNITPLLAFYSPAPAEFDEGDYRSLSIYAELIAILIAHYENKWGNYPLNY